MSNDPLSNDSLSDDPFDVIQDDQLVHREELAEDETAHRETAERERLNSLHIQSILLEKKTLYRHGTYMTIIAVALVVAAFQLMWMAIDRVYLREWKPAVALVVVAVALGIYAIQFVRRALQSRREAAATILPPPENEPDFSTLSDGSQFEDNLREMHGR